MTRDSTLQGVLRGLGFLAAVALAAWVATAAPAGAETVYRQTQRTLTDTTNITTPYATNGRTRTWAYGWNAAGQLLSVDGPRPGTADTTSYTYTALGYLETVTDPLGHVTTVTSWNGRGHPTTIWDPNGVATVVTYDIHDRVMTVTVDPGASQSHYAFEYDAVGNLTRITQPEGGWLFYTYDAGSRLTGVENDRGETQAFTPNALGDPTAIAVRTAGSAITRQQSFVYDELGRVIQAIGAGSQTTGFGYDKVDNPTSTTDARGKLWQTGFDALNRVITETNPQSQTVELAYSPSDEVTSHKDGRQLETTRVVDGFGFVIREVSPDRGTRTYWYDEAGNLTQMVDGDGQQTNYVYDAANRLTSATFAGASAETIAYTYDSVAGGNKGKGRLTGVTEESGSSAFTYDAQGRLTRDAKVIQGESYTVDYAYDRNGRLVGITLPSGRTVTIARAADGLATGITTKATPASASETLVANVSYRPFGPLQSLDYGNGLSLTRTYDQNDWLNRIEVKTTGLTRLDLSFGRNANGQLTGVTDNAASGRGAAFTYTDAGRLETADGSWGDHTYTYDAAGNRTGKSVLVGQTTVAENLVLSTTSNRVNSTQDGGAQTIRTLTWRTGGDLSQAVFTSGSTFDYTYNARKRLELVELDSAERARYGYDFRGQRVWRSVTALAQTTTRHYVFDAAGRLLAEHDGATGDVVREYVWLDDMAVAMIESSTGTPATYFIHTGQLDEPLVMTDASQAKVWDAYVEPYGQVQVFDATPGGLSLRLPGQWEEAETGFYQNWHRNYDPTLGRYIEADPLGIDAGQNVYAYALGSPLSTIDPDGRVALLLVPALGATEMGAAALGFFGGGALAVAATSHGSKQRSMPHRRYYDRVCRNSPDPCQALKDEIAEVADQARAEIQAMRSDPRHLWDLAFMISNPASGTATTYIGHVWPIVGRKNAIRRMIELGEYLGCDMAQERVILASLEVPFRPDHYK